MIRRELIIAFCFVILSGVAFLPLLLISLGAYEGTSLERVEDLLFDRQELLIALGTLFLVLGLSVWTGHLSNKSAERRDKFNRRTQAEIKISEFRQIWINDLRDDMSRLISLSGGKMSEQELAEYQILWTRIDLRLNPNDTAHIALVANLGELTEAIFNDVDPTDVQTSIQKRTSNLLKGEWDRLKKDLKNAHDDGLEEE